MNLCRRSILIKFFELQKLFFSFYGREETMRRRRFKRRFKRQFRRSFRRYRKFKRFYRKKRGHLRVTRLKIKRPIVPDTTFIKFKYNVDEVYTPTGNGSIDWRVIRCSNPADPDTAITNQPTGWDQWATFYNYYRVQACKIVFRHTMSQVVTTTGTFIMPRIFIWPSIFSTFPAAYASGTHPQENPMVSSKTTTYLPSNTTNNKKLVLKKYMTTKKMYPLTSTANRDFDGVMTSTTDPTNVWYMACGFTCANASPANEQRSISVTYYVQMYKMNQITVST